MHHNLILISVICLPHGSADISQMTLCCWQAPGWPSVPAFCQYDKAAVAVPQGPDRPTAQASHKSDAADGQRTAGQNLEKAVHAACQRLIAAADDLDDLDEK